LVGERDWDLNQGLQACKEALYYLSHTSSTFFSGYFGDGVSQTICPGWSWAVILPVSAFQVARILGISHLHQIRFWFCSSFRGPSWQIFTALKYSLFFHVIIYWNYL
jgi:hypothetical protein